jgi:(p)ppGpp synthase/HD superfamily hydrolase
MKENLLLLEKAITIAVQAHAGQKDRYGAPYILHPLRVMSHVNTTVEKIIAILHDVVEDTQWTFEELAREGFGEEIVEALDCVTRRKGEAYEKFVDRSVGNSLARRVKLADLRDNMELGRADHLKPKDVERFNKYLKAWKRLTSVEDFKIQGGEELPKKRKPGK